MISNLIMIMKIISKVKRDSIFSILSNKDYYSDPNDAYVVSVSRFELLLMMLMLLVLMLTTSFSSFSSLP